MARITLRKDDNGKVIGKTLEIDVDNDAFQKLYQMQLIAQDKDEPWMMDEIICGLIKAEYASRLKAKESAK